MKVSSGIMNLGKKKRNYIRISKKEYKRMMKLYKGADIKFGITNFKDLEKDNVVYSSSEYNEYPDKLSAYDWQAYGRMVKLDAKHDGWGNYDFCDTESSY